MIDFEADAVQEERAVVSGIPLDSATAQLSVLAQRQVYLEAAIASTTKDLERFNGELHILRTKTLPEKMQELGITKLTLADGSELRVAGQYFASIPSETAIDKAKGEERAKLIQRRLDAFSWLRDNGHEDLIKNEVTASFGKGEDDVARALLVELSGKNLKVTQEETVHSSTLKAFVKEQAERGIILPEALGAFKLNIAEIKRK
jgi:hypothetical protein